MTEKIKKRAASSVAAAALIISAVAVVGAAPEAAGAELADTAVYRLLFDNDADIGANSAGGALPSANVVRSGGVSVNKNAWKGNAELVLTSAGKKNNYVEVPTAVMNYESVTLAGWFKIPSTVSAWGRLFEIHDGRGDSGSWVSVMPYAPNYYNGLNINMHVSGEQKSGADGADNFLHEGADTQTDVNTPAAKYILPVYDAWVHYAYEFTPSGFSIYQNGKLLVQKAGDFTASKFYGENGVFYLGATDKWGDNDISCSISDFRVYSSALGASELASEFDFDYTDFLTASYDFEDGVKDGVRGYDGSLVGNAAITDGGNGSNALVVDGTTGSDDRKLRSSAKLQIKLLHGHNELSVSADFYVDSATGNYSRLMEFAASYGQYLTLGSKWDGAKTTLWFTKWDRHCDSTVMFDIPYDRWFNLCFTLDGENANIYIDGRLAATSDAFDYKNSIYWEAGDEMQLTLGATAYYDEPPSKCRIDNVKIYQTALSDKNVLQAMGVITIDDDAEAVASECDKFELDYDGGAKLVIPEYAGEGVRLSWTSDNEEVLANDGTALPGYADSEVNVTVTFTRGEQTMEKTFKVTVKAKAKPEVSIYSASDMGDSTIDGSSYYAELMNVNLDYMMSLNKDRLLYNYRRQAGLNTKGAESYGAWISPTGGGAGQFEAHYITALAKASMTMPNYSYNGETVLDRLTYMVIELKKCRDAFSVAYPEERGYIGAISTKHFDALVTGERPAIEPDGTKSTVWVPWYFYHKQLEAMLDVYLYAVDANLREIARDMLVGGADWAYNRMSALTDAERATVLRTEYGGMAEVLFQTYSVTGSAKHFNAAKYFEEKGLLDNIHDNKDVFAGLHSNTTIPKLLGAAAAYELTGDEYYKTVCENGFNMVMTRTYAFGGTSIGEHWTEAGKTDESLESAETCCSYNMMKLADYLFRWTGEKKYADYYENVYTNHILASMDPDTGGKTYLTNTAFGYYKIYHSHDNSFWCCACSGMENFAQLPQGIYYKAGDTVRVNMFYPSEYKVSNDLTIKQSGDFYVDQKTTFTACGSGRFTLALRVPDWAKNGFTVKLNGAEQNVAPTDGYVELDREFSDGDTIEYSVPFSFGLDKLKGHERANALMYGPLVLVADLGTDDVHDIQDSQLAFGTPYTGNIVSKIALDGTLEACASVSTTADGKIAVTLKTSNQGDILFRPFNQVFHSRYGMYFDYYEPGEDIDADYTVSGNELGSEFDTVGDLDMFDEYGTTGGGRMFAVENGWLVSPAQGENKLMTGLSLDGAYVIELKLAPYTEGGAMNGGVYIMATGAGKPQDMINAYNIQVEREAKMPVYTLSVFKFGGSFLGPVTSASLNFPSSGIIELHILVKDGTVTVFVNGSRNKALEFSVDQSFMPQTAGDIGIRSQVCKMKFDGLRVISEALEVGRGVLVGAINVADGIDRSKYTSDCVARLDEALADAKAVRNTSAATQAQVNFANSALRAAIEAMREKGDRTAIDRAYSSAVKLDGRNYTAASFARVKAALTEIANTNLSDVPQSTVDMLTNKLIAAVMSLEAVQVDRSALDAAIEHAEMLVSTDYTEESFAALTAAIAKAKALDADVTADRTDAALIELLTAETMLVRVNKAPEPENPDNPNDPDDPTDNPNGDNSGGKNNSLDGLAIAAIAVSSVMLAAVVAFTVTLLIKRKKSKKEE